MCNTCGCKSAEGLEAEMDSATPVEGVDYMNVSGHSGFVDTSDEREKLRLAREMGMRLPIRHPVWGFYRNDATDGEYRLTFDNSSVYIPLSEGLDSGDMQYIVNELNRINDRYNYRLLNHLANKARNYPSLIWKSEGFEAEGSCSNCGNALVMNAEGEHSCGCGTESYGADEDYELTRDVNAAMNRLAILRNRLAMYEGLDSRAFSFGLKPEDYNIQGLISMTPQTIHNIIISLRNQYLEPARYDTEESDVVGFVGDGRQIGFLDAENDPDFDEEKADRNKDGKISDWERAVGNAVAKAIRENKEKKGAETFEAKVGSPQYKKAFGKMMAKYDIETNPEKKAKILTEMKRKFPAFFGAETFEAETRNRYGNRYITRDSKGRFKKNVSVGRSLKADRRRKAKRVPSKSGQGDKGDYNGEDMSLKDSAKLGFGVGAGLLGFNLTLLGIAAVGGFLLNRD